MIEQKGNNDITGDIAQKQVSGFKKKLQKISLHFGFMFVVLFLFQAITGMLLGLYYKSYPQLAFESILHINGQVSMGWFVKSLHDYSSYFVTGSILIFLMSFFFSWTYSRNQKLFWYSGLLCAIATVGFLITSRLLPWDETSFYATVKSMELISQAIPFGEGIAFFLTGGEKLTSVSLARFHALHTSAFPIICFIVISVFLFKVRFAKNSKHNLTGEYVSDFFLMDSNFFKKSALLAGSMIAAITILSVAIPWSPGIRMDELLSQPQVSSPDWYVFFAAGLLKIVPATVAKLISGLAIVFLIAVPFAISKSKSGRMPLIILIAGFIMILAFIAFVAIGAIR
jgi:quinol-cytochrome oxidoreductase complex cytochrome b subunit